MSNDNVTQDSKLTAHQALKLAVESSVHPRTVARAYAGKPIRSTVAARITEGCGKLGFPLPPIRIAP